jgi:hypothetical protein
LWLTDFEEAVRVGMAVHMTLKPAMTVAGRLDRLLVFGVDEESDAALGARRVTELLDAHYYTQGLAYIEPGTPTKNTEAVASGHSPGEESYCLDYLVRDKDFVPSEVDSGAARLAVSLGIRLRAEPGEPSAPEERLGWDAHIAESAYYLWLQHGGTSGHALSDWVQAEKQFLQGQARALGVAAQPGYPEERIARAMNAGLWDVGWGYFLSQMLVEGQGDSYQWKDPHDTITKLAYAHYLERCQEAEQNRKADPVGDWMTAKTAVLFELLEPCCPTTNPGEVWVFARLMAESPDGMQNEWLSLAAAYPGLFPRDRGSGGEIEKGGREILTKYQERAYEIWQQRGIPAFDPLGDWLAGEQDFIRLRTAPYAYYRSRWREIMREKSQQIISDRAYYLWLQSGKADGTALNNRYQAERELMNGEIDGFGYFRFLTGLLASQWRETMREKSQQIISDRAYYLWLQSGKADGTALNNWYEAERELMNGEIDGFGYFRLLTGPLASDSSDDWALASKAERYTDSAIEPIRQHFVDFVRPGGPLPSLRIADQPYGILPVGSLDLWQPDADEVGLACLAGIMQVLRDKVWMPSLENVPRVGWGDESDPVQKAQQALLNLLATAPLSQDFRATVYLGADYMDQLAPFLIVDDDSRWRNMPETSQALMDALGVSWVPRLGMLVSSVGSVPVSLPVVGEPVNSCGVWLRWLSQASGDWQALRAGAGAATKTPPLLYRLLRHSGLRAYADAAIKLHFREGSLNDWEHLEPELINLFKSSPATLWSRLTPNTSTAWTVQVDGKTEYVGDYIRDAQRIQSDPALSGVAAFQAALSVLAQATAYPDSAEALGPALDRIFRQILDACSYRLDAWLTSFATRRLAAMRKSADGVLLGAYAWIENLSNHEANNDGYIHAPSLGQAVTAAVLRSGYTSHSGGEANPFAVNLSSERVRLASWLLDGIRNGQSLSSLGGYIFERKLHEVGADVYLPQLRDAAPTQYIKMTVDGPQEAGVSYPVVDGLLLRDRYRNGELETTLKSCGSDRPKVEAALKALDYALDATADALMAESVHHVVNGNPSKAAATLDALARGDGSTPELEFMTSKRTGTTLVHRVLMVTNEVKQATGWSSNALSRPRALASPTLHTLVAGLLPNPARVRCAIGTDRKVVRLSQCNVSALDCVYAAPTAPEAVPGLIAVAVLDAAGYPPEPSSGAPAIIDWARPDLAAADHWDQIDLTLPEFLVACDVVRQLLRRSGVASRTSLASPFSGAATDSADSGDSKLATRADAVAAALRSLPSALGPGDLRTAAAFGVVGAAEALLSNDSRIIEAVQGDIQKRITALTEAESNGNLAGDKLQIARIQAVLGAEFKVLPAFSFADPPIMAAAMSRGQTLASAGSIRQWLYKLARVRPGVALLQRSALAGAALAVPAMEWAVVQLPNLGTEPWIAGPVNSSQVSGPRANLVLCGEGLDPGARAAGLVIDEWTETVLSTKETTGIAFHYETARAEAPQAVLLAVPPDLRSGAWTPDVLEKVLLESFDLSKLRAVDPDALRDVDQFLPALYLANNASGDAVSTELFPQS